MFRYSFLIKEIAKFVLMAINGINTPGPFTICQIHVLLEIRRNGFQNHLTPIKRYNEVLTGHFSYAINAPFSSFLTFSKNLFMCHKEKLGNTIFASVCPSATFQVNFFANSSCSLLKCICPYILSCGIVRVLQTYHFYFIRQSVKQLASSYPDLILVMTCSDLMICFFLQNLGLIFCVLQFK